MRENSEERNALDRILSDLETRLEAYVDEWWLEHGIEKRPGVSIDQNELQPKVTEQWEGQRRRKDA